MSPSQAQRFDAHWQVLGQQELWDGFSAVLFQPVDSAGQANGQKVLAIRGSESSNVFVDYLADAINIALLGTNKGMRQYQSLEDFYQVLIAQGTLAAGESVVVTGHSLGGFLAQAFAAKHSSDVSTAYTFNSPGFSVAPGVISNIGTQLLEFFGIVNATIPSNKIYNLRAVDGLSAAAGLGQMIGSVEGIRIEAGGVVHDHSIVTLTDSLTIQQAIGALDPTETLPTISRLFVAAGRANERIEGLLDGLRSRSGIALEHPCFDIEPCERHRYGLPIRSRAPMTTNPRWRSAWTRRRRACPDTGRCRASPRALPACRRRL